MHSFVAFRQGARLDEVAEEVFDHGFRLRHVGKERGIEQIDVLKHPLFEFVHALKPTLRHANGGAVERVFDDIEHGGSDALAVGGAERGEGIGDGFDDSATEGIIDVAGEVSDAVAYADDGGFEGGRGSSVGGGEVFPAFAVAADALAGLFAEIEALSDIDDSEGLLVVAEAGAAVLADSFVEGALARVAERGVADIVAEGDGFDEIFVQAKSPADGSGDLGDFEGVSEAGPVVVAERIDKNLGLVLQTPEWLRVEDAVAVALESGADRIRFFRARPARRVGGAGGIRRKVLLLASFDEFTDRMRHYLDKTEREA